MALIQLAKIAMARSGDKSDTSDISLFAPNEDLYRIFRREVTPERVKEHFRGMIRGKVTRYEAPNVLALKFVCEHALGGGAPSSIRTDNLGKCFGSNLLRMEIEIDDDVLANHVPVR